MWASFAFAREWSSGHSRQSDRGSCASTGSNSSCTCKALFRPGCKQSLSGRGRVLSTRGELISEHVVRRSARLHRALKGTSSAALVHVGNAGPPLLVELMVACTLWFCSACVL